ncbi:YhcN/YlaJ family sporulation lipoprotein [Bacillus sp. RD4P76]|uniref:YhcN/YlaJ family sporulation lipoprotein n=2 Tax=Bacillus suaedaesalsae TaxID=2810349 RepID=A0ABS2DJK8_9BACI|nr:YhcN/YlaJ family sporulation lipoprotein [Bacillus suaedaesalsae]MBM6618679.1 YhcN/YlaJ family sporulation lipoprotein [Bacillus suaedaesalsae]
MLTACQYEAFSDDQDFHKETGNRAIHVSDKNELYNSRNMNNNGDHDEAGTNFGFVRHQKSPIAGENEYYVGDMPQIDREQVADLISKMTILLPNVNDVGTLVTDEEVLIAYETDSSNRFETADQVKKTAMSVVPRWYHVYVSDEPMMIDEVQKYGRLDSNSRDIDRILDTTIKDMLNAPQGRKLSDGENANGEMINENNEEIDEDMNEGTTENNTGNTQDTVKTDDKDDRAKMNDTDDNGETYRNNRL